MVYAVGDLIIRVKNGYMAKRESVEAPYSKLREALLKKLKDLKYISNYQVEEDDKKKLVIELSYKEGMPAITDVKIFSTPGRRWYVTSKQLKSVLGGMGYSILSTSHGLMTNVEAKNKKVGGELLFNIW